MHDQVLAPEQHSAEEILALLRSLNQDHGKTIVMVTHDPKAAGFASRQLHIDKGQLIDATAPAAA